MCGTDGENHVLLRGRLEAFLGDLDTTPLPTPQRRLPSRGRTDVRPGFAWISSPHTTTTPVHSGGGRFLSRPPFTAASHHRCRNFEPARHRLRPLTIRDLGLGSDSPWDVCRCPGTLRLPVWRVSFTAIHATHSGIRACGRSTRPSGRASPLPQRSPTMKPTRVTPKRAPRRHSIRGFGGLLEPRYIVGAGALDQ